MRKTALCKPRKDTRAVVLSRAPVFYPSRFTSRPTHTRSASAKKRRKQISKEKKKQKLETKHCKTAGEAVAKTTKLGRMLAAAFTEGRQAERELSKNRRAGKRAAKQATKKQSKAGKRQGRRRRASGGA